MLSDGAVQLPVHNVSVRIPWHDTDWTGRVCRAPAANHSCTVLKRIQDEKLADSEEEDAGLPWAEAQVQPPCVLERAGFMRTTSYSHERLHPYRKRGPYAHFAPTVQEMDPHSLEVLPFLWVITDGDAWLRHANRWQIGVNAELEEQWLDASPSNFLQDHRNQLAMLDTFFSAIKPKESLVLLYVKDLPLLEEREPGGRYLVGAARVQNVGGVQEWAYDNRPSGGLRSIIWERNVRHTIRPDFTDGFLLPYQQLLRDPDLQGEDLSRFVARTPGEHFDEFSFAAELVSYDASIAALGELGRVLEELEGVVEGPWEQCGAWAGDRLAEAWHARGAYPGLGQMLVAGGLQRGPLLARRALDGLDDDADPWPALEKAIADNLDGHVGRSGRKSWEKITADASRYRQLRVMSRSALSGDQAKTLFDGLTPAEVLEDPYRLYEHARRDDPAVALTTIDRGMFPRDTAAKRALERDPLPEPLDEDADDRRVRAAMIETLEIAAGDGHTLLDDSRARADIAGLSLDPPCEPVDALWEVACDSFGSVLVQTAMADGARAWQLDRLAAVGAVIRAEVARRTEQSRFDIDRDWAAAIDAVIEGNVEDLPDEDGRRFEQAARDEKAEALETIMRSRISALIGPAGTGKTSMLEALVGDAEIAAQGVLLLAPTGKAAVQLATRTHQPARTLASFLRQYGRYDGHHRRYQLASDQKRHHGARTVVIDEASMLTEEMLAATIDTLSGVDRLILCGDPRQLPPIGAGRPFADLVRLLEREPGTGGGLAELRTGRRARADSDAVKVASLFSLDAVTPGADEALDRVLAGQGDGTLRIVKWHGEDELHEILLEELGNAIPDLKSRTRGGLCRSLGASCEDDGLPSFDWGRAGEEAEIWQVLSPVRARPGGINGINRLVRQTWRPGDARMAKRSRKLQSPTGADQVIFADKVMLLDNLPRDAWDVAEKKVVEASVANGEVGLVVFYAGRGTPKGHKVELSSQPGLQFSFWANELDSGGERARELMELAYAVTIHKSQGSQFATTFVVVPDPCPLLSPELLYTALTRQRERVVVLKQGDLSRLRLFGDPAQSETARRLTCLFSPAAPRDVGGGRIVDASHVHVTKNNELVRSKSEVIVANALADAQLPYIYEAELRMKDGTVRLPDFTIERPGKRPVYWEHLGMLDLQAYRKDWEAKQAWYAAHEVLPVADGGGAAGILITSEEGPGIDSLAIEAMARTVAELT